MAVHHQHGREAAAAQAGHFIECELARGVRVGAFGDRQVAPQFFGDLARSRHVASGPMADAHDMFADRRAAEPRIERRHARDFGGSDFGEFAEAAQSFVGQIAIVGLNSLQQRDGGFFGSACLGDSVFDERRRCYRGSWVLGSGCWMQSWGRPPGLRGSSRTRRRTTGAGQEHGCGCDEHPGHGVVAALARQAGDRSGVGPGDEVIGKQDCHA